MFLWVTILQICELHAQWLVITNKWILNFLLLLNYHNNHLNIYWKDTPAWFHNNILLFSNKQILRNILA